MACVYYELFSDGKSLLQCNNNLETYKQIIKFLKDQKMDNFPQEIQNTLKSMIAQDVRQRIDIKGVLSGNLFSDTEVKTLRYIASIAIKDTVKKVFF